MTRAAPVATPRPRAYLRGMPARLLRLLVLLAIVLMPVRMAAQAHLPAESPGDHAMAAMASACGDHEAPADEGKADLKLHCMMACAALPGTDQALERLSLPGRTERPTPTRRVAGRSHSADPPPPRFS